MNSYQSGNTIKITATFKDEGGNIFDPAFIPSLKLYSGDYSLIDTFTPVKESEGIYHYFLTLPEDTHPEMYIYEWKTLVDGKPVLKRQQLKVDFV